MNQSNVIFGFIFAAFVIFITQRGELPIYLGFLLATPKASGGDNFSDRFAAAGGKNTMPDLKMAQSTTTQEILNAAKTAAKLYAGGGF